MTAKSKSGLRRPKETPRSEAVAFAAKPFDIDTLAEAMRQVHERCAAEAGKAVNISLTIRNWLMGFYIREYEQNGSDRGKYGAALMDALSERLAAQGVPSIAPRSLRLYRQFYTVYPQIWQTLSAKSPAEFLTAPIWQTLSAKLTPQCSGLEGNTKAHDDQCSPRANLLLQRLSFSHFAEFLSLEDPLHRAFYETECLRGNWSVRELKRQIASLYYERSGLSRNKDKLAKFAHAAARQNEPRLSIRDPYIFEFLGLKPKEVMSESVLEEALLDNLQEFLLELGHGFCFEARQKRILLGETYGFIDLVFYHRVLKCHILVELKLEAFSHENIGQLNTYVSWYRQNVMGPDDNPPIGILLCARKDHGLVEYALAGMDNHLFVSRYQLELPKKEEIQRFIETQMKQCSVAIRVGGVQASFKARMVRKDAQNEK